MANSSAKKLIKANAARLTNLKIAIAAANLFFAVFRLILFRSSFTTFFKISWVAILIVYALPFYLIWSTARPTFSPDGSILSGGHDISKPGLLEYAHDIIYLTILVQALLSFSRFALLLFLVIPGYIIYTWASSTFGNSENQGDDDNNAEPEDFTHMSRKDRRKADRASRKQK